MQIYSFARSKTHVHTQNTALTSQISRSAQEEHKPRVQTRNKALLQSRGPKPHLRFHQFTLPARLIAQATIS